MSFCEMEVGSAPLGMDSQNPGKKYGAGCGQHPQYRWSTVALERTRRGHSPNYTLRNQCSAQQRIIPCPFGEQAIFTTQ